MEELIIDDYDEYVKYNVIVLYFFNNNALKENKLFITKHNI